MMEYKVLNYKKLTVNEIRKKYWDKNKKIGKPISYFAVQTYGDVFTMNHANEHPPFFSQPDIFIPDGTLHHYNMKTKKKKIWNDWLTSSTWGPYQKSDENKGCLDDFYYLGGTFVNDSQREGLLQICSRPLNVVSEDCMDEVHCWIKRGK